MIYILFLPLLKPNAANYRFSSKHKPDCKRISITVCSVFIVFKTATPTLSTEQASWQPLVGSSVGKLSAAAFSLHR